MLGTTGLLTDDGRSDIAISQLGTDHLIRLALLDIGDAGEVVSRGLPLGRGVADTGAILRTPFAPAQRRIAGRADVSIADLAALYFI